MTHQNWLEIATDSLLQRQNLARAEAHTRARLLLDGATSQRYAHLLQPAAILEAATLEKLQNGLERAQNGEPLPYILGRAPFFGRDWEVGAGVLIPRPETETLIEAVLARLDDKARKIADLGTGSGIIAATLALERPSWRVWATEISPDAQKTAARNFQKFGLESRVQLLPGESDNWLPFSNSKSHVASQNGSATFDLLVSNPPYIAKSEIEGLQIEVRGFEPHLALDGGKDGLAPYRQIAARGRQFLTLGGWCAVEIGADQGQSVSELFQNHGWEVETVLQDLAGLDRVVLARNR